MKQVLRNADPGETGGTPPAAAAVQKSDASPEEALEIVKLRQKLTEKDKALKERETRIATLEDENHRLKKIPAPSVPAPAAAKTGGLSSWLWD